MAATTSAVLVLTCSQPSELMVPLQGSGSVRDGRPPGRNRFTWNGSVRRSASNCYRVLNHRAIRRLLDRSAGRPAADRRRGSGWRLRWFVPVPNSHGHTPRVQVSSGCPGAGTTRAWGWYPRAPPGIPSPASALVGSLNKNRVVAIGPNGAVSDRVTSGNHGLASVAGIHVDTVRRTLWVTSNRRFDRPSDSTPSRFAVDLASGRFRARYPAPGAPPHFANDLTSGPDGTVYVQIPRPRLYGCCAPVPPPCNCLRRREGWSRRTGSPASRCSGPCQTAGESWARSWRR